MMDDRPVLVTGATGYVGGRLVPLLLSKGYRVRAMGRSMKKLLGRPWAGHPNLETVKADMHDLDSLVRACEGCFAAFYLVHSMSSRVRDFALAERHSAYNMVRAACHTDLPRIIYLSGLGVNDPHLSKHLRSRAEVAEILGLCPSQVTVLRAAMIIGSGSASFELLRYLSERVPVMLCPKWVRTRVQPISISNVLGYLAGCLENPKTSGQTYDIGGPDIMTYEELFQTYAEEAGLKKRVIIPLPFLSPRLSSAWIHFITPVPGSLARELIEGLRNEVVCTETSIRELIPQDLIPVRGAIRRALQKILQQIVDTTWHDAGPLLPAEWVDCGDADYSGGQELQYGYSVTLEGRPEEVWPKVSGLGDDEGWYGASFLFRLRGLADRILGGVGIKRGRRHPTELHVGDSLDFWRVLRVEEPSRLVLLGEVALPGEGILEFRLEPEGEGRMRLVLLARFLPRGVGGLLYWYAAYPFHRYAFKVMLLDIARHSGKRILAGPVRITPVFRDRCILPREPKRKG